MCEGACSVTAVTTVATLPKYSLLDEATSKRSARVACSAISVQTGPSGTAAPQTTSTSNLTAIAKTARVCSKKMAIGPKIELVRLPGTKVYCGWPYPIFVACRVEL